jgi:hypothetical protein
MSKKHFIELANVIIQSGPADRSANGAFSQAAIFALADFCKSQNPNFNRDRWLGYIAGENGPSGGRVKHAA